MVIALSKLFGAQTNLPFYTLQNFKSAFCVCERMTTSFSMPKKQENSLPTNGFNPNRNQYKLKLIFILQDGWINTEKSEASTKLLLLISILDTKF